MFSSTLDPIAVFTSKVVPVDFLQVIETPELWIAYDWSTPTMRAYSSDEDLSDLSRVGVLKKRSSTCRRQRTFM